MYLCSQLLWALVIQYNSAWPTAGLNHSREEKRSKSTQNLWTTAQSGLEWTFDGKKVKLGNPLHVLLDISQITIDMFKMELRAFASLRVWSKFYITDLSQQPEIQPQPQPPPEPQPPVNCGQIDPHRRSSKFSPPNADLLTLTKWLPRSRFWRAHKTRRAPNAPSTLNPSLIRYTPLS